MQFIQENLADFNGKEGDPASFANLQRLVGEQYYVLAFWQNVNETINYRRFFTITDLVGMRVEDSQVFDATHTLILRLISRGAVSGLRIDHIDGLRDPLAYLKRLQERAAAEDGIKAGEQAVRAGGKNSGAAMKTCRMTGRSRAQPVMTT